MALRATVKDTSFGVGDRVRVVLRIADGDKTRESAFEGMVLKIKGRDNGKTFTVRKISDANVGVERIFPLDLPTIEKVVVVKKGTEGVRRSKLYFTRHKSPTEIEAIYKKAAVKLAPKAEIKPKKKAVAKTSKKVVKSKKK